MSDLFIASKPKIEHDDGRRVLATGRTRGGSALLQVCARFGDIQATGTREAAARRKQELAEALVAAIRQREVKP